MIDRLKQTLQKIDAVNAKDPNSQESEGKFYPKELLYAERMTDRLNIYAPDASEALQIAARAQHIKRWQIPREEFPMDKVGYFNWRNKLKLFHAKLAANIMLETGYDENTIDRVKFLIEKKKLKKDEETQILEDVICFVFLEYYVDDFAATKSEEKMIDILRKTWRKMSDTAKEKLSDISISDEVMKLIRKV